MTTESQKKSSYLFYFMLSRHRGIYCRVHFSLIHSVTMASKSSVADPDIVVDPEL
jgi:hypothetical protein